MSCVYNWFLLLLAFSASQFWEIKCEQDGVKSTKTKASGSSHQGKFGWVVRKWFWSSWITCSVWAQQSRGKERPKPNILGMLSYSQYWKTIRMFDWVWQNEYLELAPSFLDKGDQTSYHDSDLKEATGMTTLLWEMAQWHPLSVEILLGY